MTSPFGIVIVSCDTFAQCVHLLIHNIAIHAVDRVHMGKGDSSVLYIPICPTTETNAKGLKRQRECFINGTPSPDFPGGIGESQHVDRCGPEYLRSIADTEGLRAAGFEKLSPKDQEPSGSRRVIQQANQILGF